jgi:hypothetical protein
MERTDRDRLARSRAGKQERDLPLLLSEVVVPPTWICPIRNQRDMVDRIRLQRALARDQQTASSSFGEARSMYGDAGIPARPRFRERAVTHQSWVLRAKRVIPRASRR